MSIVDMIDRKGLLAAASRGQRFLAGLAWLAFMIGLAWITWSTYDRISGELPIQSKPIAVTPAYAAPGETINVTFMIKRSQVCYSRSEGYVIDSDKIRFKVNESTWRVLSEKIGDDTATVRVRIPLEAATGLASYRVTLYQSCAGNPIHLVWPLVDVLDDASFEIISSDSRTPR